MREGNCFFFSQNKKETCKVAKRSKDNFSRYFVETHCVLCIYTVQRPSAQERLQRKKRETINFSAGRTNDKFGKSSVDKIFTFTWASSGRVIIMRPKLNNLSQDKILFMGN